MSVVSDQLKQRIASEVATLPAAEAELVRQALVTPYVIDGHWKHRPGLNEPLWVVADFAAHGIGVVFAEAGYAPERPWAPIWLRGPKANRVPDDASWTETLSGAIFERYRAHRHCCGTMAMMAHTSEMAAIRNATADAFAMVAVSEPTIDFLPSEPVFLIGSVAIVYCPWCGANLTTPPTP